MLFGAVDRYIGKTVLKMVALILFGLLGLSGIIKFIEQLRRIQGGYDTYAVALFTLLMSPKDLELFFPMAALLGGLIGLGFLALNNELVAMEAAGYTRFQIGLSVMKTAIPLIFLSILVSEFLSPLGEQAARELRVRKLYGTEFVQTQEGLWLKDTHSFVYIKRVLPNNELQSVSIFDVNDNFQLKTFQYAAHAFYENNKWQLRNVETMHFDEEKKIAVERQLNREWQTNIMPDKLGMVVTLPESLSMRQLHQYIDYLRFTEQDERQYTVLFWTKSFQPLSIAVMMLLALSFVFGSLRSMGLGIKIMLGISFGFLFFIFNRIFGSLAIVYHFPAILAAILPSLLFLGLAMYLFHRLR